MISFYGVLCPCLPVLRCLLDFSRAASTVEFTLDGCDSAFFKQEVELTGNNGTYYVPAHKVDARVTGLQSSSGDRTEVLKSLRTIVHSVNLGAIGDLENNMNTPADGGELNINSNDRDATNKEATEVEKETKTIRFVRAVTGKCLFIDFSSTHAPLWISIIPISNTTAP